MRSIIDLKYMFLNCVVCRIPSWRIRKALYRFMGMKIGKGSRIGIRTVVFDPKHIVIGDRTIINEYCHIDGRGNLIIGNDTSISIYTKIITATHDMNSAGFQYVTSPVIIGDNVWIGADAIILNGSQIRKGAIIGAGCVFKGDADDYEVYVGNPAKRIKKRNEEMNYHINYHPHFR